MPSPFFSIFPSVRVLPLPVTHGPLRIVLQHDALGAPPLAPAEASQWSALQKTNSKYFDGPILRLERLPAGDNTLHANVDRYARLAVQSSQSQNLTAERTPKPRPIRLLSVTGVLLASDTAGREHVLLGQRASNVRCYPTMWELGPSGGLEVPANLAPGSCLTLTEADIVQQLAREMQEEVGLAKGRSLIAGARATAVAILQDDHAFSDDIIVIVNLAFDAHDLMQDLLPANWEYTQLRLVPLDTLAEFDSQYAQSIIPPTRTLFRALGWLERD